MKKIFTLMVSITLFTTAFAQYGRDNGNYGGGYGNNNGNGRDVTYNDGRFKKDRDRYDDRFSYSKREMEMQVARINRDYDRRIEDVKSRFFMPRFKKEQMICKLEEQRKQELRMVYSKFSDRRNRYCDDDDHGHRNNW